jgi:hypothetical protein
MNWFDVWIDEPYMNILLYQNIDTRFIIDKLEYLERKNKCIVDNYVIGLFKNYNDKLIDKYGVDGFMKGLYNLLKWYNYVKEDKLIIKKSWMNEKNRKALFKKNN